MTQLSAEPETKSSVQSITVLGSLIVLAVTMGKLFGVDLSVLTEVQAELVVVGGAVLAIIGRFRASKRLRIL